MRIVAGELGGRRLVAPTGDAVRPTSDRVREAIFSILADVGGDVVLDLFAGTGALGIEALSRGARSATFVDRAIGPAATNVDALGVGSRCTMVEADAVAFLARDAQRYDLVFCDPPYRLARRVANDLDKHLPARLADGGRVICESDRSAPLRLRLPELDRRAYGSTSITIHGSR